MKDDPHTKMNENENNLKKRISKVKVSLTLGHTASHRDLITSDEKTHDWSFYVRGDAGTKIESYIDKVIFTLHESFPNPIQVIKEQPYEIYEQGYGTFLMQVEVKFKNKREPKNIHYKYDLLLPGKGVPPIKRSRKEILTFTNPNSDFMGKLLEGGGLLHHYDTNGNILDDKATNELPSLHIKSTKSQATSAHKASSHTHMDEKKKRPSERKREKDRTKDSKPKVTDLNSEVVVKSDKKHKSSKKEHSKGSTHQKPISPTQETTSENKDHKSQLPMSSVLASIGDIESSDDEKYFKYREEKPPKSVEENITISHPKKVSSKSKPSKEMHVHVAKEDAFLEFDQLDSLKSKKLSSKSGKSVSIKEEPELEKEVTKKKKKARTEREANSEKLSKKQSSKRSKKRSSSPEADAAAASNIRPEEVTQLDTPAEKLPEKKNKHKLVRDRRSETVQINVTEQTDNIDRTVPQTKLTPEESPNTSEKLLQNTSSSINPSSKRFPSTQPDISVKTEVPEPGSSDAGHTTEDMAIPEYPDIVMDSELMLYRLNVYKKLALLQSSENRQLITEVVNMIAERNINISDNNVSFDLVHCDLETLQNIDNVLS